MPTIIPELESSEINFIKDQIIESKEDPSFDLIGELRRESQKPGTTTGAYKYKSFCSLLADLTQADWSVEISRDGFILNPPTYSNINSDAIKDDARKGFKSMAFEELKKKQEHIDLIRRLEKPLVGSNYKSIFTILDDGEELKKEFERVNKIKNKEEAIEELNDIIKPEIHHCFEDEKCPITNLRLIEIWRYLRFTWSMTFNDANTRRMPLLVRNAARPNKPVIGIAQFVQPFFNNKGRNEYLKWDNYYSLMKLIKEKKINPTQISDSFHEVINEFISDIRVDDFIPLIIKSKKEIKNPTEATVKNLSKATIFFRKREEKEKKEKKKINKKIKIKEKKTFLQKSETNKNMKKRSWHLSRLLHTRKYFKDVSFKKNPSKGLAVMFQTDKGRRAINTALFYLRIRIYSTQAVDLSTCGAVAPYNEIIGGKLVTLLMASKNVFETYEKNYEKYESIIASELAGKKIIKPAKINFISVSSLYDVGTSQYNRLKILKKNHPYLKKDLCFEEAGKTMGTGNYHISTATRELLDKVFLKKYGYQIGDDSGDGSDAKKRKAIGGLSVFIKNAQDLLVHNQKKPNYIFFNKENIFHYLYGIKKIKNFNDLNSVNTITKAWIERWLFSRIKRDETLNKLKNLSPVSVSKQLNLELEDGPNNLFSSK